MPSGRDSHLWDPTLLPEDEQTAGEGSAGNLFNLEY